MPTGSPLQLRLTLPSPFLPPPRLCVLQSLPQTWLRPRLFWVVGPGSTASQGTLKLPRPWLLPSRPARYCRWNSFGTTGPRVSDQWDGLPRGMCLPAAMAWPCDGGAVRPPIHTHSSRECSSVRGPGKQCVVWVAMSVLIGASGFPFLCVFFCVCPYVSRSGLVGPSLTCSAGLHGGTCAPVSVHL